MSLKRKADTSSTSDAKKPKNATITSFFGPPKSVSVARTPAGEAKKAEIAKLPGELQELLAGKGFDKKKWAEKLTPEQRDLLGLEIETLHESWFAYLKDELVSKEFLELKRFLKREHEAGKKIFPPSEDVYSWYAIPFFHLKGYSSSS
jgi:uracil-DNA glycosylase